MPIAKAILENLDKPLLVLILILVWRHRKRHDKQTSHTHDACAANCRNSGTGNSPCSRGDSVGAVSDMAEDSEPAVQLDNENGGKDDGPCPNRETGGAC